MSSFHLILSFVWGKQGGLSLLSVRVAIILYLFNHFFFGKTQLIETLTKCRAGRISETEEIYSNWLLAEKKIELWRGAVRERTNSGKIARLRCLSVQYVVMADVHSSSGRPRK